MTNLLTVLIVDDEPIAQDILETFVNMIPFLRLIKKCDNAIDAIQEIQKSKPDIVFLDVQMPKMTGFQMMKVISVENIQIIVTTAFPNFALEGFDYHVTDYLLKPIPFERFFKAVNKASENIRISKIANEKKNSSELLTLAKESVWIKQDKKLVQISLDDIILVKAMKDYMQVFVSKNKCVIAHITMGRLEEILTPPKFLRVNRSCIVSKDAINLINGNSIETDLDEEIIIGVTYRDSIKEQFRELF